MKYINLFCLILAVVWTVFLAAGFKSVPPVGALLSPAYGVWAHKPVRLDDRRLEGLKAAVVVTFDAAGVPHFFAQSESDLLMAQGYVMASQRLFQMDLITRITAGRLSEWFGSRTAKMDDFFVRFGMRESARRTLQKFNEDARTANLLNAFAAGVNAFIGSGQLPPEYLIAGVRPEPWDAMRTVHMGKQLTFGLAGRSYDHYLSRIQQSLGTEKVLDLFPEFSAIDDFIYPSPRKTPRRRERPEDFSFVTSLKEVPFFPLPAAGNGSNNWAVSAGRSATGMSIMANDTHLGHTLPNVWYENQLSVPGYNVYGVALVAIPGIVNGFNSKVSWGPTNGTTDVLDYYEVEFEGETSFRYRAGGEWLEAEVQVETIIVRDGEKITHPVAWTKYGVIVHREGRLGLAADWRGHATGQELKAIHGLYSAENLDDCIKSFGAWQVPVQNFICADQEDIAIHAAGFLPKREIGRGRFIMKAGDRTAMAEGVSEAERPRVVRPASGFVLSANQRQTDEKFPYYFGWDFEDPYRGRMIRRRLQEQDKFTPEDFIRIQNDDFDPQAELALPLMLELLAGTALAGEQALALEELKAWDYRDGAGSRPAALFKEWFEQLRVSVFGDEYKVQSSSFLPKDARLIELLGRLKENPRHPDAAWVDDKLTEATENIAGVAAKSFQAAWAKLAADQGDFSRWSFKNWVKTRVPHIGRFPGFGVEHLAMDGSAESIRGNQGGHGAVYKVVVAHGEWPRAWISVPGGNEGDPFSRDYGRGVREWAEGKMRPVEFYRDVAEARANAKRVLELRP